MSGDPSNPPLSPVSVSGSTNASASQQLASPTAQPSLKSPKTNPTLNHPQGPRSQSLDPTTHPITVDPRDRPGSSRTKVVTLPPTSDPLPPTPTATQVTPTSPTRAKTFPLPATTSNVEAESSLPPYRSPEPVYEPPEEHPEGFVPGVVEEHGEDFSTPPRSTPPASGYASPVVGNADLAISRWQADLGGGGYHNTDDIQIIKNYDQEFESRLGPQLGPGNTARRVLEQIHQHRLVKLSGITIPPRKAVTVVDKSPTATTRPLSVNPMSPTPTGSGPTSSSSQPNGTLDYDHIRTAEDVDEALPGGLKERDAWYFCWKCCQWWKIDVGDESRLWVKDGKVRTRQTDSIQDQDLEWDVAPQEDDPHTDFDGKRGEQLLRGIENRLGYQHTIINRHFHEIRAIGDDPSEKTLERIDLGEDAVRFPHTIPGMEVDPKWFERSRNDTLTKLFLSCGTREFIRCETGPVAGQIPPALLKAFIQEKQANPNVGASSDESVTQALQLLMTYVSQIVGVITH
jgi:hypothetical protein